MPIRVLIADPDAELRRSCVASLTRSGYVVATASNGVECIARLRAFHPHVLILEPVLPWGWGEGVLAMMCEGTDVPMVPVILVTDGSPQFSEKLTAPVWGRLSKPLQPRQLLRAMAQLLQSRLSCSPSTEDQKDELQRLTQG